MKRRSEFRARKAALEAGHSVRALARSARRIPVDHPRLEKMVGDALEMTAVKRALTGIDAVTQSLGVSAGPEIIFEPTRLFSKATQVLVTAMQEERVKRLICVTGFGAGDSRGSGGSKNENNRGRLNMEMRSTMEISNRRFEDSAQRSASNECGIVSVAPLVIATVLGLIRGDSHTLRP
jgi:hypothetical protein